MTDRPHIVGCPCHWCGGYDGIEPIYAEFSDDIPQIDTSDVCQDILNSIRDLSMRVRQREEKNTMLPNPTSADQQSSGSGKKHGSQQPPSVPYLGVADLSETAVRAKILAVIPHKVGYNDMAVKVDINGRRFFLGLKTNNPNFEKLFNAFGNDEKKWLDQDFLVANVFNQVYEKLFVEVVEAPAVSLTDMTKQKRK